MVTTRLSHSFCPMPDLPSQAGILVRIYPHKDIGQPIPIENDSLLVGRDESSHVRLVDDSVSRRHAAIEWDVKGHRIVDLCSTNGTFVNEARIQETRLQSGDRVRFGNQIFKYLSSDGIESQYHEVIFKLMTTDGLTQVYNKRFFLDCLERELLQSAGTGTRLCVLMMDLDRFKTTNDTFGHLAGDAVLIEFARRTGTVIRSGEIFARFGGEEFALLCTRSTLPEAAETAERIRSIAQSCPVVFDDHPIAMTVSIGVAESNGREDDRAESLLAKADKWLYAAKNGGRNQVQHEGIAK